MTDIQNLIISGMKLSKNTKFILFPDLVKATCGYDVIPLNILKDVSDKALFEEIKKSANDLIKYGNKTRQRFQGNRINDIGKAIEEVFVQELRKTNLNPELLGKSGYPDMKITDSKGRITYIESKAVSKGWDSSFRSFYYTDGKKIGSNARHLLIAWDIFEESPKYWQIKAWKMCDLSQLKVNTKLEFNASNKNLRISINIAR